MNDDRYSHRVECAVRALQHATTAAKFLTNILVRQQSPDFNRCDHQFRKTIRESQRAIHWARIGLKKHRRERN
jgi:hypothetical protein